MQDQQCNALEESLGWCEGKPVLPGIRRRIYYTSKSNVVQWPVLPVDALGRPTSATLTGSFHLKADACFKYIDVLTGKSGIVSDPQGEYPSQTQLNKLTAVHPGKDADASMAAAYLNNNDVVCIVQEPDGSFRVIGNEKYQGKATVQQDGGQGPAGTPGTTINIEHTDLLPAPFYTGEIPVEGGYINELEGPEP